MIHILYARVIKTVCKY